MKATNVAISSLVKIGGFFLIHLNPLEESIASLIQHKSLLISVMNLQANLLLPTMLSHQVMRSAAVKHRVAPGKKLPCLEVM